jgi:hypothetical protein
MVDDLVDFDKDAMEQISAILRRPAGRIPDPNPAAAPGAIYNVMTMLLSQRWF